MLYEFGVDSCGRRFGCQQKTHVKRYEYKWNPISNVSLETAGTIDLDVEIKFTIGNTPFSIDISKNELDKVKDLYKALVEMERIMKYNDKYMKFAQDSLEYAQKSISHGMAQGSPAESFKAIAEFTNDWLTNMNKNMHMTTMAASLNCLSTINP